MSDFTQNQDRSEELSLPFEKNKQLGILGHLIFNETFFLQVVNRIKPEWFANAAAGKVFKAKIDFYNKYHRPPSKEELLNADDWYLLEDQRMRDRVKETIRSSEEFAKQYGLDAISTELTSWMHAAIFEKAVPVAQALFNKKQTKKAYDVMKKAVDEINDTVFNQEHEEDFSNWRADIEQMEMEFGDAITTGSTILDKTLNPRAKSGSLLKGDMTLIITSTGGGKTSCLLTVAMANIKAGKRVCYVSLEGRSLDIKTAVRGNLLNKTSNEILEIKHNTKEIEALESVSKLICRFFTFMHLRKPGLTVEEVLSVVRKKNADLKVKNNGKGFDLIVFDYPGLLTTQEASGGKFEKRHIYDAVYLACSNFAEEMDCHVLAAVQTNRAGSKINNSVDSTPRLLTKEDILEAFGPTNHAANVITVNASPRDRAKRRLTYYIDKSRTPDTTGWAVVCKTNFLNYISHSNELGATRYRGTSTYTEQLDLLLDDHIKFDDNGKPLLTEISEYDLLGLTKQ